MTKLNISSPAEDWRGNAALGRISLDGTTNVAPPDGVLNYLFAGRQCTPGALPLKD